MKALRGNTTKWNVSLNRRHIDAVYYDAAIPKDEVKRSLVEHDGYDYRISLNKDKTFAKSYMGRSK